MILFPAIDLYEKKAVRLYKGDYRQMTVYSENPLEVAQTFERLGATAVHLVDLEGAKTGTTPNLEVVKSIAEETGLFTEIGGGIRSLETMEKYFSIGVGRVILGTAAVEDPDLLKEALKRYGGKIAVGADVRDGMIAIKGWQEQAPLKLEDFLVHLQEIGVQTVICTDISRDGAMKGTNLALYAALAQRYSLQLTASGGVSSLEDVKRLAEMNLYGAIIGKAYYTGDIDLKKAIEVTK